MRGVPQSGLWSEEEVASSGTGSERAKVASVAEGKTPASQGPSAGGRRAGKRHPVRAFLKVLRVGERGGTCGFSLSRTVEGKAPLAAEGKISCRSIDASWKPTPIPKDLRKALTG